MSKIFPMPIENPLGNDIHHLDYPLTDEDTALANHLAFYLGTLHDDFDDEDQLWEWWFRKSTSVQQWAYVVRALRMHGLTICETVDREKNDENH